MKKITVNLKERSYPIYIGARLGRLGSGLSGFKFSRRVLVITNTTVKKLYFSALEKGLKKAGFSVYVKAIPDGERYKTLETVSALYEDCLRAGLDRRSPIIALGGGVVGDIAGFVAATYMRGLPFVQVPTTLLAMVDSSVGGKTGVDLAAGKNLVGAFYQPSLVWMDMSVIKTLPERQIRNGLAEVIKYGIIGDAAFFSLFENKAMPSYEKMVEVSCLAKAKVVEEDEYEKKGLREILNYGHTIGHAIETATGYKKYLHGEAIAIGMVAAAAVAARMGLLKEADRRRIENVIARSGLPVAFDKTIPAGKILSLMSRDKKVVDGKLRMVLPVKIGKVVIAAGVAPEIVKCVL